MNLEDNNISFQLYKYLCDIVGSEEVVRTRREIFAAKDIGDHITAATFISSGSKAEGIDLKGSDYDLMILCDYYRVYECLNDGQYDLDKIMLSMDTDDTKPGFTKLMLGDNLFHNLVKQILTWFETVGEKTYLSSKRVREKDLKDDIVIHGPCQSTPGGGFDFATCLRCKEWISPAQQWIHRSRTTWPDYTLVTSSVKYGVLFVPVGCKNSPNEDLQWRISFSVTEKWLIHSFSHTQLLCYALMKIILKDIIKLRHGDLICSYFIKTIMFWLSEEISPIEWKPDSMTSCFLKYFKRLVYCVEYQTCLHYFIPEINLFEDRFTDNQHKELLETLRDIYRSPWIAVFHTTTLKQFLPGSVNLRRMELTASELSCFTYISLFMHDAAKFYFYNPFVYTDLTKLVCAMI
ncbi:cyclic GMP-AMP synthase-like [Mytilus edulis]|uniref:cyclic GMP-AMP synthase-like n=1 Tax=Mytilus edulis TaxID=6550 RepID=UPI0039F0F88A